LEGNRKTRDPSGGGVDRFGNRKGTGTKAGTPRGAAVVVLGGRNWKADAPRASKSHGAKQMRPKQREDNSAQAVQAVLLQAGAVCCK